MGTTTYDASPSVSSDHLGNVYVCGSTNGSLGGINSGDFDVFVGKFDSAGVLQWTRQLGSRGSDVGDAVATDVLGNVYVAGYTLASLEGSNAGSWDAFVIKYDSDGNLLWTEQWGTTHTDYGHSISADSLGNVYVCGFTGESLGGPSAGEYDAFVSKLDASGNLLWTQQLGTSETEWGYGISVDGLNNVFITGMTYGDLSGLQAGGGDAFIAKLVVPEPATLLLVGLGAVMVRKRRRP